MILTTSRKPSRKTRSLAKVLSRFLNWEYVNRGKMSLDEVFQLGREVCILSEIKGNPAFLHFYRNGKEFYKISFTVSNIKKVKMDDSTPVFVGKAPFDPLLLGVLPQTKAGLKLARKVDFHKKIYVRKDTLHFYYRDELVFTMKIVRLYDLSKVDKV